MGYDLRNEQGNYFGVNGNAWDHCFEAAIAFDWKPAGTLPPEDEFEFECRWSGRYFGNDYQRVTDEDARKFAAALRKAIAAAIGVKKDEAVTVEFRDWNYLSARARNAAKNLNVRFVSAFAEYCEKGGFRIG